MIHRRCRGRGDEGDAIDLLLTIVDDHGPAPAACRHLAVAVQDHYSSLLGSDWDVDIMLD